MKKAIVTDQAPAAVGPYSQAIECDGLLWCSMQLPLDPATGEMVCCGAAAQAERVLENLKGLAGAAGASLDDMVRVTLYLTDMGDFAAVNEVFARYFTGTPPARACLEATALPKGAAVAADAVARIGK
jgi:2-iminobutanoate/2-iminopropanoate deaminase